MKLAEQTYKEFEIYYNESEDKWRTGLESSHNTLSQAKEHIDKHIAKERAIEPFQAYYLYDGMWNDLKLGSIVTVTSKTEDGFYWIKNEKGKRSKENKRNIAKSNPENMKKILDIKSIEKEIDGLLKEKNKIKESIELVG